MADRIKKKAFFSVRRKLNLAVAAVGILLVIFGIWLISDSMTVLENDMMNDRLTSDIRYLRETLGEGEWSVHDGALYLGETRIGDGTEDGACIEPFLKCENTTGTFFYTFMRTYNDDELAWSGDKKNGYMQGHYIRVAGTTRGADGESIIGTYIDKTVADALENSENGIYSGNANVNGRAIYCRYELIRNEGGEAIGIIVDGRSAEEMQSLVRAQKIRGVILICAALLLMSLGLGFVSSKMLSSIGTINKRLETIGTGDFPEEPLYLNTNDEIQEIAESINDMVESLRDKARLGAELSVASDIQLHMMPQEFTPSDNYELFALVDPAKEIGGDFYDFYMIDGQHLAIVIADVSGKGVPAALIMVVAKTLMNYFGKLGVGANDVMTEINDILCEGNDANMFVTAWMGILDLETGELSFTNAGHNPPMLIRKDGEVESLKYRHGFVLAGMEGAGYQHTEVMMNEGDTLFLYTDGVTESTDTNENMFGTRRLRSYLDTHRDLPPRELVTGLMRNVEEFVGEAEQFDDITMLAVNFKRKGT